MADVVASLLPACRQLPKAELHLHIEGTLEPEMMVALAQRNSVTIPYPDVESVKAAYHFQDLDGFLAVYYAGMSVLIKEQDFFDLAYAYFERAAADGVVHAEIFFDFQAHVDRGVDMDDAIGGVIRAAEKAKEDLNLSVLIIPCFLRHLDPAKCLEDFQRHLLPWVKKRGDIIVGVGLDSSEKGNPPELFEQVFQAARSHSLQCVAHAGEEGPPQYVSDALSKLGACRIDHGIRCMESEDVVNALVTKGVPLTVCPLSNVSLKVTPDLSKHPIYEMVKRGLKVTVNSDDPAYFGGYVLDNFRQMMIASPEEWNLELVKTLCSNSLHASLLSETDKAKHLSAVQTFSL